MKQVIIAAISILLLTLGQEVKEFEASIKSFSKYKDFVANWIEDNSYENWKFYRHQHSSLQTVRCFEVKVEASSELSKKYKVENAIDGKFETSWVEGKEGPGIGEWVQITIKRKKNKKYRNVELSLHRIAIFGGIYREKYYKLNNRIKRLLCIISYKGKSKKLYIKFKDKRAMHSVFLPEDEFREYLDIDSDEEFKIKFVIDDVYKGSKWNDTPIAEINMFAYEHDMESSW